MTPQEQQLLQGLADRVNQTVLSEKDPDAEQFIQQSLSRNPDALYILAQTVLVQQYALDQAKQQLDQLKQQQAQQAPPPKHSTSFLGNLLGMNDEPAARPAPPPPPPQYAPVQTYAPQQAYPPQQPMGGGGFFGGGGMSQGGGFLQSAMRTATGVAAGALAFEGIESLMHGFGQHAGYGSGFEGMGGGGRPEEVINNNYYGDSSPGDHSGHGDLADRFAAFGDQPSSDIEDRRDNFANTSSDNSADDNSADDNSADDSSFDDSSDSSSDFDSGSSDDSSS